MAGKNGTIHTSDNRCEPLLAAVDFGNPAALKKAIVHFLYTFLYSIPQPVVLCNFSSELLLIYMKLGRSWYIGAPADVCVNHRPQLTLFLALSSTYARFETALQESLSSDAPINIVAKGERLHMVCVKLCERVFA